MAARRSPQHAGKLSAALLLGDRSLELLNREGDTPVSGRVAKAVAEPTPSAEGHSFGVNYTVRPPLPEFDMHLKPTADSPNYHAEFQSECPDIGAVGYA
jgi:hypothetical protein